MKANILIILHITLLFCFSCDKQLLNSNNEARNVRAVIVTEREQQDEATGFGSLSFLTKVDITSPQDAVIKKLYFREGSNVKQGQIIIQLENPQINLAVERAENSYSQAAAAFNLANSRLLEGNFQAEAQILSLEKAELELSLAKRKWEENNRKHQNQETLFDAGGINTESILNSRFNLDTEWEQIKLMERELNIRKIGCRDQDLKKAGIAVPLDEIERHKALVFLMTASLRAELEASKAMLEASRKELASANIALKELTITSPASGVIGVRYLEEGERVKPQDKIFSLIDTTSLYAIIPVREKDALRIEKGMSASVLIDGTGETKNGIVDLIYPQADSQSLSFLIRILIKDTEKSDYTGRLKPGMFARAAINLGPANTVLFIPESSIFNQKNNQGSVFVINGSVLTERKISLGSSHGEEREIKTGLKTGEIIVQRPDSDLREGVNVTVIQ